MIQAQFTRDLGASGLNVSPLGGGTNSWVYGKNDTAVLETYKATIEAGIKLFDTAEVYGFGKSERLLGECLKQSEHRPVIASKYAPFPTRQLNKALDGSLSRLGLTTLDLYFVHFPFSNIEGLMDQMAAAVQEGKIRAVGVSNFSADQMRRAADRLARYDIPLTANEVQYHLLHRQPEINGILDVCRELNVALIAYTPLSSGRLKINQSQQPQNSSFSYPKKKHPELQETLLEIAASREKSISQVMLNWLLCRDEHIIPIPGTTSKAHAKDNAEAMYWKLNDEEFSAIDQASSPQKP